MAKIWPKTIQDGQKRYYDGRKHCHNWKQYKTAILTTIYYSEYGSFGIAIAIFFAESGY